MRVDGGMRSESERGSELDVAVPLRGSELEVIVLVFIPYLQGLGLF